MADTSRYEWPMPTPGGSAGTWGTELVALFDDHIEEKVFTIDGVAAGALQRSGGTMEGNLKSLTATNVGVSLGTTLSGATPLDLADGDFFHGTFTASITISFTNPPASGDARFIVIELRRNQGSTATITWPASVKWHDGATPTLDNGQVGTFVLYTRDGGTTYRGIKALDTVA